MDHDNGMDCMKNIMSYLLLLIFSFNAFAVPVETKFGDVKLNAETASRALYLDSSKKIKSSATVSDAELGYLDGVTSAIQTQINTNSTNISTNTSAIATKQDTITGAATTITTSNLSTS